MVLAVAILAASPIPVRSGGATAATLMSGQWWRLITSQFLHVYVLHALLNAAAVAAVGFQLERAIGSARMLIAYFVSGTMGQLVAVLILPTIPASGASQAALGISALLLTIAARTRSMRLFIAPALYAVVQLALDLTFAHTVKLPHLASFAIGLLFGFGVR